MSIISNRRCLQVSLRRRSAARFLSPAHSTSASEALPHSHLPIYIMFGSAFVATVVAALAGFAAAQESHRVTMTNNCGSGNPVFLYEGDSNPQGPGTINGKLLGGIAWIDGFSGADCQSSGVNCGIVEFTLRDDAPNQNAADFSLLTGPGLGNHHFTYPMAFNYLGACSQSATCASQSNCPGAYTGSNTTSGAPVQCIGREVGIHISFC